MTAEPRERRTLGERLKAGERLVGVAHSGDSLPLLEICGHLGFDLVIIQDRYEEVAGALITAAAAVGLPSVVAVDEPDVHLVVRAFSAGASGVLIRGLPEAADVARARSQLALLSPVERPPSSFVLGVELGSGHDAARLPQLLAAGAVDLVVVDTRTLGRGSQREPWAAAGVRSSCDSHGVPFGAILSGGVSVTKLHAAASVLFVDSTDLFARPAAKFMRAAHSARRAVRGAG